MPALPPYIPARDADLNNWAANFSTLITASPGTYGLVSGDAIAIAGVVATWAAAYALAINPPTRTPVAVSAKDSAKVAMLATLRPYAQQVANNAGVTTGNKTALGVNPRTSTPVPITAPTTAPTISIISAPPLQHIIAFRDSTSSPSVKAKPYGVTGMQLVANTTGLPTVGGGDGPDSLPTQGIMTKSPFTVTWSSGDIGKTATYVGRWITRKGLVGPWSTVATFTIAGST
jgi:hypothetical protein